MSRVLVLIFLAVLVWICVETAVRRLRMSGSRDARRTPVPPPPREVSGEALVRCASCGVHVPLSRSLSTQGSGGALCERCSRA